MLDNGSDDQVRCDQLSFQQNAAICIPPALFQTGSLSNSTNVGVFFGLYERGTFFPIGGRNLNGGQELQLRSNVLSATITGQNMPFKNLTHADRVKVLFRLHNTTKVTLG